MAFFYFFSIYLLTLVANHTRIIVIINLNKTKNTNNIFYMEGYHGNSNDLCNT